MAVWLLGALSKEMVRRPGVEAGRLRPGAVQPGATEAPWPGEACTQEKLCHDKA